MIGVLFTLAQKLFMNTHIQKALDCIENADMAGYFEEMDKVEMPKHLKPIYAQHKKIFVLGAAPYDFSEKLEVFAKQVLAEFEKNNQQLDSREKTPDKENLCQIPSITQLTGSQVKLLIEALSSAFPSVTELAKFVRIELDKNLNAITGSSNITDASFELITHFEAEGKLHDLISKACQAKSNNPKMKDFVKSL